MKAPRTLGSQHKQPKARGRSSRDLQTHRYRKIRASKLATGDQMCVRCREAGLIVQAEHVHHRIPREQRPDLVHDWDNLEPLCAECHKAEHEWHEKTDID